jgi:outer membrane protein OmpA-like peptidoglycan-associated protein
MQLALRRLYQYIQQLELLATELNINFGLLVMGSSDISGVKAANDQLSIKRAQNTASLLENLGVNRDKIYVTGLGQIDITDVKDAARKVMFNIIFVSKNNSKEINTAQ